MAYNIPSKINSFNVYKDGTKLVGISDEVTLPDFESLTETLSGPGILGEVDDPTLRLSENPQFLAILGTKNARFFGHYLSVYSYLTSKTE